MIQQKENDSNRTYRVEDIIKILDIGRTSAHRLINEGHFKTVRIKSFDEWLDNSE